MNVSGRKNTEKTVSTRMTSLVRCDGERELDVEQRVGVVEQLVGVEVVALDVLLDVPEQRGRACPPLGVIRWATSTVRQSRRLQSVT